MKTASLLLAFAALGLAPCAQAVHVILTGGAALKSWEQYRGKGIAHDNWWANFVRASTIRIAQLQQQSSKAAITWIVYRPAYIKRGREDGKPYMQWIRELAVKYGVKLVWTNTGDGAIRALNRAPRSKTDFVESFYYFGHSNPYCLMLDYSSDIVAVSTQWIHETDLAKIDKSIFRPQSDCRSYGCYTGMSMSGWWRKIIGVPMWGNMESTQYAPVSNGRLPHGSGDWVQ